MDGEDDDFYGDRIPNRAIMIVDPSGGYIGCEACARTYAKNSHRTSLSRPPSERRRTAHTMRFGLFHCILWLFMCTNAVVVYSATQSVSKTFVTTLTVSIVLQLTYFGYILLLLFSQASPFDGAVQRSGDG
ncbi:hypothetical protein HFO27_36755 [Rhizobium leguminosarum]|nr:hypothetical protein [Rhizobium leguminosarum]